MKAVTKLLSTLLIAAGSLSGYSEDNQEIRPVIRPGVSRGTVIHHLGEPNARIETGNSGRYYYDRGEVHLKDNVVTYVSLMSEEAAENQREEDRLTNLEARVRAAEERSRRAEKAAAQRAWPEEYPRRSRATTVNDGIYIRYNTGRRIYYPHSSYQPIVISTQANSNSHNSQSTPPLRHWNSERHLQNLNNRNWHTHPQEETYIYGRGGNTQLNPSFF